MPNIDDPRLTIPQCDFLQPVKTVHENPWFSVKNRGGYFTIEYNTPQVLILPILDNKAIVMVRVYRPVIADNTLELPAGGANENELPVETAVREFHEETGIFIDDINRFEMLPPLIHMPRSPVLPFIFKVLIRENEFASRKDHDHEIQKVESFQFSEVISKIINGDIYVGLHIAIMVRYLAQRDTDRLCVI